VGDEIPDANVSHGMKTALGRISSCAKNAHLGHLQDLELVPHILSPAFWVIYFPAGTHKQPSRRL